MSNGRIVYQGPSQLDGSPIVVIAIGFKSGSKNSKTGDMIQTYILRSDMTPVEAIRSGDDAAICGDCKHRGTVADGKNTGRTCYVNTGQGPTIVFKTWLAGGYPMFTVGTDSAEGRVVRLGTYGDPAAVPVWVWTMLLRGAVGHTGYTHQWDKPGIIEDFKLLTMASADTVEEAQRAQSAGWRTFRVAMRGEEHGRRAQLREAVCPASEEAGRVLQCHECLACGGKATGRHGSIVIQAHGGTAVMANVNKRMAA